jgi:hypothetical protein
VGVFVSYLSVVVGSTVVEPLFPFAGYHLLGPVIQDERAVVFAGAVTP